MDSDADVLAFAAFRRPVPDGKAQMRTRIVGIAQGQFHTHDIMANFAKNKTKPLVIRNNSIYPMGSTGLSVVFLNQTTMVFGDKDAIRAALDSRDGFAPNFLTDSDLVSEMACGGQPRGMEPAGRQGHADDDEERAGRGLADCRLRHGEEPHEDFALHDGLLEWREVRDVGEYVRHDYGGDLLDADEGRAVLKKPQGTPLEKTALDADRDRFELGHADGGLFVVGQPVCESADFAAVSVGGEVTRSE